MIGGDGHGFVFCRSHNGASSQMVCFSKEPAGTLVDGGYRRFVEDVVRYPSDIKVMP